MGVKRSVSIAGVLLAAVMFGVWSVGASGQSAPVKKSPPAPYNPKLGHQNRTTTVTAPTTTPPVALTGATNTLIAPVVPATAASTNSAPANVPTH